MIIINYTNNLLLLFIVHPYSKDTEDDEATHYRESFFEVMNEIEDCYFEMPD